MLFSVFRNHLVADIGHRSLCATFAAYAAVRRPDLVAALIAAGMDIDMEAAENHAYAFAVDAARQRGNRRATRQLEAIGPPPHTTTKQFATRARWTANFGGVATNANYNSMQRTLLASLVRSPDYSAADVIRTMRGISAPGSPCCPSSRPQIRFAPFRAPTPIVGAQSVSVVAPSEPAERFYIPTALAKLVGSKDQRTHRTWRNPPSSGICS